MTEELNKERTSFLQFTYAMRKIQCFIICALFAWCLASC